MDINPSFGRLYIPHEDLKYALSAFTGKLLHKKSFLFRIYALAELIDKLILCEDIISDLNPEEYTDDRQISSYLEDFNLSGIVKTGGDITLSVWDFMPLSNKHAKVRNPGYVGQ